MSQTISFFLLSIFILAASSLANANSSVPVTDLANDVEAIFDVSPKSFQENGPEPIPAPVPAPVPAPAPAPAVLVVDAVKANANAQMFDLVELLKRELQELRGQLEELSYSLERLKKDQKQRYLDLDRRIVSLSNQSSVSSSAQATKIASQSGQINESTSQVEGSSVTEPLPVAQKIYDPELEKVAYKAAFTLIRERQYDASIEALLSFIQDFPQGSLLGNAHYWLGEVYMVQGDASLAALSFEYVISEFPEHRKIPDALYKAGVAYQNVGDVDKANELLRRVLVKYPDSSAARLAQERVN